jgi:hypothetical protein
VFAGGEFVAFFEQSLEFAGIEEVIRKQSFFLHKPAKDQARDEANEALRFVSIGVLDVFGLGELDVVQRPEIPVGDFLEETLVEFGTVEGLLPRGLEFRPVGEVMLLVQLGEGEIEQDFDVGAVRVGDPNVFDERDFFEDILRFVAFVETARNDGKGERVAVAEQQHRGHAEEFVDFAGDARKLGAGVFGVLQGDGEEKIGFNAGIIVLAFAFEDEVALTGGLDFVARELEEEVNGLPVVEKGVVRVKRPPVRELGEECFGGVGFEFEPFLAAVAERFEERDGSVRKGFLREISEGVFDGVLGGFVAHGLRVLVRLAAAGLANDFTFFADCVRAR